MAERTTDEIAKIFNTATDHVILINTYTVEKVKAEASESEQNCKDRLKTSTEYLELIKGYKKEDGTTSIWTTEDFTDIDAAIVSGKALIA